MSRTPPALACILLLVAAGCAMQPAVPVKPPAAPAVATAPSVVSKSSAESFLKEGLQAYDDGRYPVAQRRLRDALEEGLKARADRVAAHKHLAFIYCASRQEALCRDAFRRALEIDPAFSLTSAEAGHPIWGPIFRSLKARATP